MTPDSEALLPPYDGIKLVDVRLVKTDRDAAEADRLRQEKLLQLASKFSRNG